MVEVSILVSKTLDMRPVLEVHFGRKAFGYPYIRERPINLYSVLSLYSILNIEFRSFGDRLVWVLILVRKRLALRHVF